MLRVCAIVLFSALCGSATGQSVRFFDPDRASVGIGSEVSVGLVGSVRVDGQRRGVEALGWAGAPVGHFFARTAWTQENRDDAPVDGEGRLVWAADRPGVLMLGCDFVPRTETLTPATLAAFFDDVLPKDRARSLVLADLEGNEDPIRVRRIESAKALVRVREPGSSAASIAHSKSGQTVEMRPIMDPTLMIAPGDVAVRVYAEIPGPSDMGIVIATNETTGQIFRARTNETSLAIVPVAHHGPWRFEFHAALPLEPESQEDGASWVVHSATLTFEATGLRGAQEQNEGQAEVIR